MGKFLTADNKKVSSSLTSWQLREDHPEKNAQGGIRKRIRQRFPPKVRILEIGFLFVELGGAVVAIVDVCIVWWAGVLSVGAMAGEEGDVVEITEEAIDLNKYVDKVRDAGAGAIATFLGTTRDTFEDKRVLELRYEAYHAMALEQLRRICTAARARWSLHRIAIVHRIGVVGIGEESVLVAVSSVHRKESLHACEFLIDELKASVPIWKKEVYETGEAWKQNSEFLNKNFVPRSAQDAPRV